MERPRRDAPIEFGPLLLLADGQTESVIIYTSARGFLPSFGSALDYIGSSKRVDRLLQNSWNQTERFEG